MTPCCEWSLRAAVVRDGGQACYLFTWKATVMIAGDLEWNFTFSDVCRSCSSNVRGDKRSLRHRMSAGIGARGERRALGEGVRCAADQVIGSAAYLSLRSRFR